MGVDPDRAPGILARGPWEPSQIACSWRDDPFDAGPDAEAEADAAIAALRDRGSPSHDGLAARLVTFDRTDNGELELELEPVRWSLRLGGDAADSLSALCVVRDADGRWLAGRRAAWVASWAGRWALGAGGTVEVGENPATTLVRELDEEWSVVPQQVSAEALIRIPSGLVLFVGMAHVAAGTEVTMDPEHDAHAWWPSDPADWPDEADPPLRLMAQLLAG
jgi:ADP-ribose pyrophosphatase YjhB (NUDIX family)